MPYYEGGEEFPGGFPAVCKRETVNTSCPDSDSMQCRCNHSDGKRFIPKRKSNDFLHFVTLFFLILYYTHSLCAANFSRRKPGANWQDRDSDSRLNDYNDPYKLCQTKGTHLNGYSLRGGTKAGRYVNIGTVSKIEECSNLCCQLDDCELAIMLLYPKSGTKSCFSVHCYDDYKTGGCTPVISGKSKYQPFIFKRNMKNQSARIVKQKQVLHHRPNREKGTCHLYTGTVCADYIDKSKLYYYTSHNDTTLDKRLQVPLSQLSSRLSGECYGLALQAICYRFYPQCLDEKKPKPIGICNGECEKLIYGDCVDIFSAANMLSYLKRVIPGCSDAKATTLTTSSEGCIELKTVKKSGESREASGEEETEKFMHERSEQSESGDDVEDAPSTSVNSSNDSSLNVSVHTSLPTAPPNIPVPETTAASNILAPATAATSSILIPATTAASTTPTTVTPNIAAVATNPVTTTPSMIYRRIMDTTSKLLGKSLLQDTKATTETPATSTAKTRKVPTPVIVDVKGKDKETDLAELDPATVTVIKDASLTTSKPPTTAATAPQVSSKPKTTAAGVKEAADITVSAGDNRVITLPENHVNLFASPWPKEKKDGEYTYKWMQISAPSKSHGYMEGKTSKSIKLTKLDVAGVYTFKVTVSTLSKKSHGVGFVNVTVKNPSRINHPPRAEITQKEHVIQLPTNTVILDASKSTDDDKIVSYKWEELKGPIKEKTVFGSSTDSKILQLKNLVAGIYKFRLTVTDADGESDKTEAIVTVKKEVDYPPKANAGSDVVVHLPNTTIVLNGNKSKDDKGVLKYQWSKTPDSPTCDMQGTDKSQLKLSRLQQGTYVFLLKVIDKIGQSSEAKVKVVVLPEKNTAPVAVAGDDKEIIFPDDSTTLDGTKSKDNSKVVSYKWEQVSGPNKAKLNGATEKKVHLSDLIIGTYVLKLTVTDDKNVVGTDTVRVHVKKDHNEHPVAVAGKGVVVYLPTRSVVLDASKSHDDEMIESFRWTRAGLSPAAGVVINRSDHQAILRLTNLVKGRYIFDLTVTDNKGLTGTDSVTVLVQEDKNRLGLVQLFLFIDIDNFSEDNKLQLIRKISVILEVGREYVVVEEITGSTYGTGVMVLFYVKDPHISRVYDGKYVADVIKQKVGFRGKLFEYTMTRVEPYICRNNCSEHGYCDKSTKQCVCDSFWTENFLKARFGGRESNCDWSILYLSVAVFGIFLIFIGVSWAVCFCFARKKRSKRRARYRALRTSDPDSKEEILLIPKGMKEKFSANSLTFTESDEDSEQETTVFDKKKLVNGHVRTNGTVNGKVQKYQDHDM